MPQIIPVWTAR